MLPFLALRAFLVLLLCACAHACDSPDPAPDAGSSDGGGEVPRDAMAAPDGGRDGGALPPPDGAMPPPDGGWAPLDLEALPAQLAEVACESLRRCDASAALVEARCANAEAWIREGLVSAIELAIADGRVNVHGAPLEECFEAMESARFCETLNSSPAHWIGVCRGVLAGTLGSGEACGFDWECEPSLRCRIATGTCGGTCAPRLPLGEWCADDAECGDGLVCSTTCREATPPSTVEPTFVGEGEECPLSSSSSIRCAEGLICAYDLATDTSRCRVPVTLAAGDPCTQSNPDMCGRELFCEIEGFLSREGTCRALPQEGEECLPFTSLARCAPGLGCALSGRCVPKASLGAPCTAHDECWSGVCSGSTQTCVPPSCITR